MCFFVSGSKKYQKEKIAKRDIICYKVFSSRGINGNQHGKYIRSYYRNFNYKFGIHYELDGYIDPRLNMNDEPYMISVGLHSYTSLEKAKKTIANEMGSYYKKIIIPCVIPKGSRYYHNPYSKEYVSDQIIIGKFNQIIKYI